jgi:hypothetical protein
MVFCERRAAGLAVGAEVGRLAQRQLPIGTQWLRPRMRPAGCGDEVSAQVALMGDCWGSAVGRPDWAPGCGRRPVRTFGRWHDRAPCRLRPRWQQGPGPRHRKHRPHPAAAGRGARGAQR